MKKLLLITALLSAPTYAEDDFCTQMYNMGKVVMDARQKGVPMPDMIKTLPDDISEFLKPIVISAYEHPQYSTPQIKQKTINDFADDLYLACVKEVG